TARLHRGGPPEVLPAAAGHGVGDRGGAALDVQPGRGLRRGLVLSPGVPGPEAFPRRVEGGLADGVRGADVRPLRGRRGRAPLLRRLRARLDGAGGTADPGPGPAGVSDL